MKKTSSAQNGLLYTSEKKNFSLALVGDIMVTRSLSVFKEESFLKLRELLKSTDATFGNFESCAHEYNEGYPTFSHGTYMTTEPKYLDDIKWLGVNLLSCANNHIGDFGEGGILATMRHLDAHNFSYAGIGNNLRGACSPCYFDTPNGRVALIASTSFFNEWDQAADQRPDFTGKPGINPLGFETSYIVDSKALAELKRIGKALGFDSEKIRRASGFLNAAEAGSDADNKYTFMKKNFLTGTQFDVKFKAREKDVQENLRQIREARRQADWVIVSFHCHEMDSPDRANVFKPTDFEECAGFIREFAHRCIDEGADVVAGHGPHFCMGIELYKNKPIFHSLGTFVLQNDTVRFSPANSYARFGLGADATHADFIDARSDKDRKSMPADPLYWQSFCAVCDFSGGKLRQIVLNPADLGFGRSRAQRGRPLLADEKTGKQIIERIGRISKRYGTEIEYKNNLGIINL